MKLIHVFPHITPAVTSAEGDGESEGKAEFVDDDAERQWKAIMCPLQIFQVFVINLITFY